MRALKVVLAACAAAVVLGVLAIPGQAQQSTRRPPMIRVYSTSGADVINTSTYVEPQINLSENAYVFAVEMDLDGQIQVLHIGIYVVGIERRVRRRSYVERNGLERQRGRHDR